MVSKPWTNRYAPSKLSDVIGQAKAVAQFSNFIMGFPKNKAVLFAGPPGVGKTSLIYAFAKENNYEVVEMNASDKRNKGAINSVILPACRQASLFGSKKIVVLDEIDGLSGMKDRGGAPALLKIIAETKFPLVLIANDSYSKKLKSIRKKSMLIAFSNLNYLSINKRLRGICENEGVVYDEVALRALAQGAQGDLRAAINDLQAISADGAITNERLNSWHRYREESVFEALKMIFKSNSTEALFDVINNLTEDYGVLAYWLDENLHKEYRGAALARAYDCISRSDIFRRRIMRWQHWRFLAYIHDLTTAGVQQAKRGQIASAGWASYRRPSLMLKIWQRNMRRSKRRAEMEKAGERLHASAYRLERDFLPYYDFINAKNKVLGEEIKNWLNV